LHNLIISNFAQIDDANQGFKRIITVDSKGVSPALPSGFLMLMVSLRVKAGT